MGSTTDANRDGLLARHRLLARHGLTDSHAAYLANELRDVFNATVPFGSNVRR